MPIIDAFRFHILPVLDWEFHRRLGSKRLKNDIQAPNPPKSPKIAENAAGAKSAAGAESAAGAARRQAPGARSVVCRPWTARILFALQFVVCRPWTSRDDVA